ncbi:hypothetical protein CDAR_296691 [Caerostris darwini]|uniref:Maturase K n=1 Tax=Caerostris darwini TaxID=1538125 RepID=A0AAV4QG15_9ARAC|nr:hypothetical protein CDAR_296691 [Caerostris darwini]
MLSKITHLHSLKSVSGLSSRIDVLHHSEVLSVLLDSHRTLEWVLDYSRATGGLLPQQTANSSNWETLKSVDGLEHRESKQAFSLRLEPERKLVSSSPRLSLFYPAVASRSDSDLEKTTSSSEGAARSRRNRNAICTRTDITPIKNRVIAPFLRFPYYFFHWILCCNGNELDLMNLILVFLSLACT